MGQCASCTSAGTALLVAVQAGDIQTAQEILGHNPNASLFYSLKDRTSPLLQASARGHFELVQLILEAAVMSSGPEKAKKHCIDHANAKRQTPLMVACKHGHPDCVEYLVTNGADPLLVDERRHNTCLHFAALYGHSECVHKLLGCRVAVRGEPGGQVTVAQLPCRNEGTDGAMTKLVDRHNGWGLTALHIAVFQGSVPAVRALLRHGASLTCVISPSRVENSPIRCAAGSNALHIAALIGNIAMAKLILEAQESVPGLELRSQLDAQGLRPQDYAQRTRNPVLMHLLDERLPVALLRQVWMNYSLDGGIAPRHQTLGALLQKLKLMFNLEAITAQRHLSILDAQQAALKAALTANAAAESATGTATPGGTVVGGANKEGEQQQGAEAEGEAGALRPPTRLASGPVGGGGSGNLSHTQSHPTSQVFPTSQQHSASPSPFPLSQQGDHEGPIEHRDSNSRASIAPVSMAFSAPISTDASAPLIEPPVLAAAAAARAQWARRLEDVQGLLDTVTHLHASLTALCSGPGPGGDTDGTATAGTGGAAAVGGATGGDGAPARQQQQQSVPGTGSNGDAAPSPAAPSGAGAGETAGTAAAAAGVPGTPTGSPAATGGRWPSTRASPTSTREAVLDFILSTLITPRTVSAILHAAKKLVCASSGATGALSNASSASAAAAAVAAALVAGPGGAGAGALGQPGSTLMPQFLQSLEGVPNEAEAQHSLALLSTAMRAVDTCLQAAYHLSNPGIVMEGAAAPPPPLPSAFPAHHGLRFGGSLPRPGSLPALFPSAGTHGFVRRAGPLPLSPALLQAAPPPAPPTPPSLTFVAQPAAPNAEGGGAATTPLNFPGAPVTPAAVSPDPAVTQAQGVPVSSTQGGAAVLQAPQPRLVSEPSLALPESIPAGLPPPERSESPVQGVVSQGAVIELAPTSQQGSAPVSQQQQQQQQQAGNVSTTPSDIATNAQQQQPALAVAPHPAAQPTTGAAGSPAVTAHPAAAGLGLSPIPSAHAMTMYASHWTSHLHTLIAQLQWDIGVQRHRRRRQHAVAVAARAAAASSASAAAVAGVGGGQHGSRTTGHAVHSSLAAFGLSQHQLQQELNGLGQPHSSALPPAPVSDANSIVLSPDTATSPWPALATAIAAGAMPTSTSASQLPSLASGIGPGGTGSASGTTPAGNRSSGSLLPGLQRRISSRRGDAIQDVLALSAEEAAHTRTQAALAGEAAEQQEAEDAVAAAAAAAVAAAAAAGVPPSPRHQQQLSLGAHLHYHHHASHAPPGVPSAASFGAVLGDSLVAGTRGALHAALPSSQSVTSGSPGHHTSGRTHRRGPAGASSGALQGPLSARGADSQHAPPMLMRNSMGAVESSITSEIAPRMSDGGGPSEIQHSEPLPNGSDERHHTLSARTAGGRSSYAGSTTDMLDGLVERMGSELDRTAGPPSRGLHTSADVILRQPGQHPGSAHAHTGTGTGAAAAAGGKPGRGSGAPQRSGGKAASSIAGQGGLDGGLASGDVSGEDDTSSDDGSSLCSEDDTGVCAICMDLPVSVMVSSCHHGLCVQCAYQLTVKGRELPSCPFCRQRISGFVPGTPQPRINTSAAALKGPSALLGPTAAHIGRS